MATNDGQSMDIICSEQEAKNLALSGFQIERILKAEQAAVDVPAGFHNNEQTKDFLQTIADSYPSITRLDSIGASVENRGIWALKISDNPELDEDEPCFLVEGCIHGNENHGLEACLYFIDYMVNNYGTDTEVTHWINNREIWVVPLVNPDGHEKQQRRNSNNVDLNRNFGYWWGFTASNYGTAGFSEPETRTIRDLAERIKPFGSLAFHTSGRLIIYPWAYIEKISPDNELFIKTGSELVDSVNAVDPLIQYSKRLSGAWYWHGGEHNDWMYSQYGMLSFTMELMTSQSVPPSDHENEVVLPSFRVMLRRPEKSGITGLITDSQTGDPKVATVKVVEIFDGDQLKPRKSEPLYGRYIRFLTAGDYTVEFYSPGYRKEIRQVVVNSDDLIKEINIQLVKDADVIFSDYIIDDDMSGFSQGNNNGRLNRGEKVEFGILAENIGSSKIQNVYGLLTTSSIKVSVEQDSVFLGDLDSSAIVASPNTFLLNVAPDVLPGTRLEMHIDFFDNTGKSWQSDFSVRIQGFFDDMEIEGRDQWTYGFITGAVNQQNDWQYGIPMGKLGDPSLAYSPDYCWGNDLGGSGWNGAYQNNVDNFLQMRSMNCSGWNSVFLQFYRWLNVAAGDRAYISVNGQVVWENNNITINEAGWSKQTVNISLAAGGQDSVVIRFGLKTNGSGTAGGWTIDDVMVSEELLLGISSNEEIAPQSFQLYQNYPNPFNGSTTLKYYLAVDAKVSIVVYDILGREINKLTDSFKKAGNYTVNWNGWDYSKRDVSSGLYFVTLRIQNNGKNIHRQVRKLMLIR